MTCDAEDCDNARIAWTGYPRRNGLPLPRTDLCAECREKENL